jgi:hypothetical protein
MNGTSAIVHGRHADLRPKHEDRNYDHGRLEVWDSDVNCIGLLPLRTSRLQDRRASLRGYERHNAFHCKGTAEENRRVGADQKQVTFQAIRIQFGHHRSLPSSGPRQREQRVGSMGRGWAIACAAFAAACCFPRKLFVVSACM